MQRTINTHFPSQTVQKLKEARSRLIVTEYVFGNENNKVIMPKLSYSCPKNSDLI